MLTQQCYCAKYKMRPIATDAVWSVCLSVGQKFTTVSRKTAEPIELWTRGAGRKEQCLGDGHPGPATGSNTSDMSTIETCRQTTYSTDSNVIR